MGDLMTNLSTAVLSPKAAGTATTLAVKIYSVVVNSMADERTGSKFTWFNSALRGNQNVETLTNMIQVGQYYGTHMVYLLISKRNLNLTRRS